MTTDPPHDPNAEQALIGAALLDAHVVEQVQVDPGDFYRPNHETAWYLLATLNGVADRPLGLLEKLSETGQLKPGHLDGPYLHTCIQACTTPAAAPQYARRIIDTAHLRRAQAVAARLTQRLAAPVPEDLESVLYEARGDLESLTKPTPGAEHGLRDLSWLLTGQAPVIEPPQWVRRADGNAIFYTSRVNGIYGDPESAKTWLAQVGIVEALNAGKRATIIDVDHNGPALTVERLLLLGARPDQLANPDRFRYYEPDDGGELRATIRALSTWTPHVAVLDSIGEMLPMLQVKSVDNDEITLALRTIASPLAQAGACVITIDHSPKAAEARDSGYAIGGTAKKRAIDGALIHAETRLSPAPGQTGRIILRIEKDRPGRLRATCTDKYVGTFVIDSTQPNITTTRIERDTPITEDGQFRPTKQMEAVSRFIEAHPGASKKEIEVGVHGGAPTIRAALAILLEEGHATATFDGRGYHHTSLTAYREPPNAT